MASYLDKTGLTYLWAKIKNKIPTKTSQLTNDSNYVTQSQLKDRYFTILSNTTATIIYSGSGNYVFSIDGISANGSTTALQGVAIMNASISRGNFVVKGSNVTVTPTPTSAGSFSGNVKKISIKNNASSKLYIKLTSLTNETNIDNLTIEFG